MTVEHSTRRSSASLMAASQAVSRKSDRDWENDYEELCEIRREISSLEALLDLADWDQQVMMPPAATAARAKQVSSLTSMIARMRKSPRIKILLESLEKNEIMRDMSELQRAFIRECRRSFRKYSRVSDALIREESELSSLAYNVWVEAREKSDFSLFAPYLQQLVDVRRRIALSIDPEADPYDTEIDQYEKGMTSSRIEKIFRELRDGLVPLIRQIDEAKAKMTSKSLAEDSDHLKSYGPFDEVKQELLSKDVAKAMGFNFENGRLDTSIHPFTTAFSPADVRITTRYDSEHLPEGLMGVIHEVGHALYEQGRSSADDMDGLPINEALSMGVHESQSLLWERLVGQSQAFWEGIGTELVHQYFENTRGLSPKYFYESINRVERSLIRVNADEVTYPLHIIIRFELEEGLFNGSIKVEDLPAEWNKRYREYLGVEPTNDADGVLQDAHWSGGCFGYFPSYTLGAMIACQLFNAAKQDIPDLLDKIRAGDLSVLHPFLREKVYLRGSIPKSADDLVREATGEGISCDHFIEHLRSKYSKIYNF